MTYRSLLVFALLLVACDDPDATLDGGRDAGPDAGDPDPDAGAATRSVTTTGGDVIGVDEGGVSIFRMIPYAAPPVGSLRFARPEPHGGWTEPLDTRTRDPRLACPQANLQTGALSG